MCNLDIYRAPMQQNGILDDGKSEAGAAQFPRTPFVHAVEPLDQMRKMLRRNTCAIVRKTEPELVLVLLETLDCDGGAFTGVCDGIVRQISENRIDKLLASVDWNVMWRVVLFRSLLFFWVPAHTVTFLLPPAFRVLFAALLGAVLGLILAWAGSRRAA